MRTHLTEAVYGRLYESESTKSSIETIRCRTETSLHDIRNCPVDPRRILSISTSLHRQIEYRSDVGNGVSSGLPVSVVGVVEK